MYMALVQESIKILDNDGLKIGDNNVVTINKNSTTDIILDLPNVPFNDKLISRTSINILENKTVDDENSNNIVANRLASVGPTVNIRGIAPITGQRLTTTSQTFASWQFIDNITNPFPETIASAKNPDNVFGGGVSTLVNWTTIVNPGGLFNINNGIYVAPTSGYYEIELFVNFETTSNVLINNEMPHFRIRREVIGNIPPFDTLNIGLLPIARYVIVNETRKMINVGSVIVSGVFLLTSGSRISFESVLTGLILELNLSTNKDTLMTIKKIANPI